MNTTVDPPTTLIVRPATGRPDHSAAQRLFDEYIEWLSDAAGCDVAALQPEIAAERADLVGFYHGRTGESASTRRGVVLLARLDGNAVGLVIVRWLGSAVAELKRLYVRPEGRGAGVGDALLAAAVAAATADGCRRIQLETFERAMPVAARLYRRRGFTRIPAFSFDDPPADVVAMALDLPHDPHHTDHH